MIFIKKKYCKKIWHTDLQIGSSNAGEAEEDVGFGEGDIDIDLSRGGLALNIKDTDPSVDWVGEQSNTGGGSSGQIFR